MVMSRSRKRRLLLLLAAVHVEVLGATLPPTRASACSRLPSAQEFIRANNRLEALYRTDRPAFRLALTDFVTRYNNLGWARIDFPHQPKTVFRSSILARNPACLAQLAGTEGVRTIVNLYSGDLIDEGPLASQEAETFKHLGGHSYIHVLGLSDYPTPSETAQDIHARIASTIAQIRAAPGNVLVHCVGGIHRTGEIYGILQKCFNRAAMGAIVKEYIHHAGGRVYGNPEYRAVNVDIIRSFDCARVLP